MRRETKLMHYGRMDTPGSANPPIVRASTILHNSVSAYRDTKSRRENDDTVLSYGRRGTSTAHSLCEAITSLEEGESSFLFPTGVAALYATMTAFVSSGDHLLVVDTIFGASRRLCDEQLRRRGVEVDFIPWDTSDLRPWIRAETKAVLIESPGSQTFEVMDLPSFCAQAHEFQLTVIADNTYGSSWLYQPLSLGCDVSVIAGTKYLGGHADLMMGAACAKGNACGPLRELVHDTGQTLSPDDAYACLRGMRTLGLRLERHGLSSLELAKWLLMQKDVRNMLHPGLPHHPGHVIWQRDASGCNGLLSIEFEVGFDLDSFLDRLQLFSIGSSWGGFESLAMPIDPWQHRLLPANESPDDFGPMVRLHIGLEDILDLKDDIGNALRNG